MLSVGVGSGVGVIDGLGEVLSGGAVGSGVGVLAERAAWMVLSRALLNLDDAVTRS